MAGINKVILIGNLGRDPELRYTQSGQPVATLNLATTRSYMKGGPGGERVEETEWHRVTVWGKQAEFCNQYLSKGRQVYVEGRLKTDKYEKDGQQHYTTGVVAETVQFLGGRGEQGGGGGHSQRGTGDGYDQRSGAENYDQRPQGGRGRKVADEPSEGGYDSYVPDVADDDIPF